MSTIKLIKRIRWVVDWNLLHLIAKNCSHFTFEWFMHDNRSMTGRYKDAHLPCAKLLHSRLKTYIFVEQFWFTVWNYCIDSRTVECYKCLRSFSKPYTLALSPLSSPIRCLERPAVFRTLRNINRSISSGLVSSNPSLNPNVTYKNEENL